MAYSEEQMNKLAANVFYWDWAAEQYNNYIEGRDFYLLNPDPKNAALTARANAMEKVAKLFPHERLKFAIITWATNKLHKTPSEIKDLDILRKAAAEAFPDAPLLIIKEAITTAVQKEESLGILLDKLGERMQKRPKEKRIFERYIASMQQK